MSRYVNARGQQEIPLGFKCQAVLWSGRCVRSYTDTVHSLAYTGISLPALLLLVD